MIQVVTKGNKGFSNSLSEASTWDSLLQEELLALSPWAGPYLIAIGEDMHHRGPKPVQSYVSEHMESALGAQQDPIPLLRVR